MGAHTKVLILSASGRGSRDCSWQLAHSIYEFRQLPLVLQVSFPHVPTEQNAKADMLANWGGGGVSYLKGMIFQI